MSRPVLETYRDRWRREIAASPTWGTRAPARLLDLVGAVAMAAALIDGAISYWALDGSIALERNPIASSIMHTIGIGPTILGGTILRLGIVAILLHIAVRAVRPVARWAAAGTLVGAALWWTLIIFLNAVAVGQLGKLG